MEIILLSIGKKMPPWINEGKAEYERRLKYYVRFTAKSLPDIKDVKNRPIDFQKDEEGKKFLSELNDGDFVVLLDEKGKESTSLEFSNWIDKNLASGKKRLVFIIGGPYGFSQALYNRADALISLSRMTFTHEMVPLIFTEQLYRAMTIIRGEPYHHV